MALTYTVRSRPTALPSAGVVLVFWKKGALPLAGADARRVASVLKRLSATGEAHERHVVSLPRAGAARDLLLVGLGERATLDIFRRGVAAAVQHARKSGAQDVAVMAPEELSDAFALGVACAEGAELGGYVFAKYRRDLAKQERNARLRRLALFLASRNVSAAKEGLRRGTLFAEATRAARDLVNEPAAHATPEALAGEARRIVRESRGRVTVDVLDRTACAQRGMGAFLAVAQGSENPPFFIHLTYAGTEERGAEGARRPTVALVGKGITFDSGGLNLKSAEGMETMKIDMAGAAAVLGVFSALPKLDVPLTVHGFVAACENMPSGSAVKPGDIVTASSGKTIEILNTDAEGRLTLADALWQATRQAPDVLVDLATLTGACVVSLGEDVAGLFSNHPVMAQRLLAAASHAGEPVWELPLVDDYREQLKSVVADVKNVSAKRWGGAVTAALFLREFVGKTPWLHLDIAGPAYAEQQVNPVVPAGGSGFGVRTLLRFLEAVARETRR